jgi:hypothetical protein
MEEHSRNNLINIYPNPVNETLTIECKTQNALLKIKDLLGKEVKHENFTEKTKVDVSDLNEGVYFSG